MSTINNAVVAKRSGKRGSGRGHSRSRSRQSRARPRSSDSRVIFTASLLFARQPRVVHPREESDAVELQVVDGGGLKGDVVPVVNGEHVALAHDEPLHIGKDLCPLRLVHLDGLAVEEPVKFLVLDKGEVEPTTADVARVEQRADDVRVAARRWERGEKGHALALVLVDRLDRCACRNVEFDLNPDLLQLPLHDLGDAMLPRSNGNDKALAVLHPDAVRTRFPPGTI